jgi:sialate O-acetylesterase
VRISKIFPAWWETQGYRNYDRFAWYRKEFIVPEKLRQEQLVLMLGKIDDLES